MHQADSEHDSTHKRARALRVGGLTALSATDYPGLLSAVVFCQGCPWQCSYCHNPHLLATRAEHKISWQSISMFLTRRRGLLDAIVFSGGEPTMQDATAHAMREVRGMGFRVGLHTAGIYPRRLQALLPLSDWVAMDIKAPFAAYPATTGRKGSAAPTAASLRHILDSGVDYEFRTTVDPALLPEQSLTELAHMLAEHGVRRYALQEYRAPARADTAAQHSDSYLTAEYCQSIAGMFQSFSIRRAN